MIRLIQSDGSDCFTVDATLTTNVHGNGEAIAVDAIDRRAKAVNVIVDTGKKFEKPTYRAPDKYALVRGSGTPSARAHPSRFSGHGKWSGRGDGNRLPV